MRSIRRRLLTELLLVGVALCVLMAWAVGFAARSQVDDLLDYQLEQVARTLIDRDLTDVDTQRADDPAMHLEIEIADRKGHVVYTSNEDLRLPPDTPLGLATIADASGEYDQGLRVFTLRSQLRTVRIIQPMSLRRDLAREAGAGAVVPALVLLAALALSIVVTIRRELLPLQRLSQELETRGADALTPIELPDAPAELRAPLSTLNRLFARLDGALRRQREFVADAAHELRSPLTVIRLQAANVAAATDEGERRAAVEALIRGVDRGSRLVQQLLTLARMEPGDSVRQREAVDLRAIAEQGLVDHVGAASARGIQIGLNAGPVVPMAGDREALSILLDNVVGNAIKFASENTPVEVAIGRDGSDVVVEVRDHGPGIPSEERERVFERFHRLDHQGIPGSGLGLAIAAAVVRSHRGTIELRDPPAGNGLLVRVRLPVGFADDDGVGRKAMASAASETGHL
jgi:two-component system, OmpR family, sensor kinase